MNALIVYWHPEPRSFNHALFDTAVSSLSEAGHQVRTSDLHAASFDPVSSRTNFTTVKDPQYLKLQLEELHASQHHGFAPDIEAELQKLEWCDLLLLQFPLWWFGLPATMKGWVDRVFAMGRTYGGGRVYEHGVFRGKRAMLSLTTGGPEMAFTKEGFNGDLRGILRPIHRGILEFVGFEVLAPHVVFGPARLSDDERNRALTRFRQRLLRIDQEPTFTVGRY